MRSFLLLAALVCLSTAAVLREDDANFTTTEEPLNSTASIIADEPLTTTNSTKEEEATTTEEPATSTKFVIIEEVATTNTTEEATTTETIANTTEEEPATSTAFFVVVEEDDEPTMLRVQEATADTDEQQSASKYVLVDEANQPLPDQPTFIEVPALAGQDEQATTEAVFYWSNWTDGACSQLCGGGQLTRYRVCIGGDQCEGDATMNLTCNEQPCEEEEAEEQTPVAANDAQQPYVIVLPQSPAPTVEELPMRAFWSDWATLPCSKLCGGGVQRRMRVCIDGDDCEGESEQKLPCNEHACATTAESITSAPFAGQPIVIRLQAQPMNADGTFPSSAPQQQTFYGQQQQQQSQQTPYLKTIVPAPQFAQGWSEWTAWTPCTLPCNGGHQGRMRRCYGGGLFACPGLSHEQRLCNMHACPLPMYWQ